MFRLPRGKDFKFYAFQYDVSGNMCRDSIYFEKESEIEMFIDSQMEAGESLMVYHVDDALHLNKTKS
ncbi:hypothetical protein [Acinetobacter sp. ANC 3813]|uniref:hypothetical protein n=1 Tax=Acinetobacter sp. ANC 3813 TaxID=1977873 RepID=UPI000A3359AE|nr:hypothetical protein [Acinetobacter sp. ANC 3813]OTG87870.1 hypothetical protein B9T34_16165 [Acinetobacter sp. ANC 3813]